MNEQSFRQWWGRYTGTAPDGIDADHAWESFAAPNSFGLCEGCPPRAHTDATTRCDPCPRYQLLRRLADSASRLLDRILIGSRTPYRIDDGLIAAWTELRDLVGEARQARAPKCPDALLPDGPVCPRCGERRAPSGIDGGSWVHYPSHNQVLCQQEANK